jgi:hypothetical protein
MDHVVSHVHLESRGSDDEPKPQQSLIPKPQTTFQAIVYGIDGVYQAIIRDDRFIQVLFQTATESRDSRVIA